MNYTPNHHLPQWVSSDRVLMEDFNQMSLDIENSLDSANASAQSALAQAKNAKASAETALAKASDAFTPDNLPYTIGSYTGTNASSQMVKLGFQPSFLIISGMQMSSDTNDTSPFDRYFALVGYPGNIIDGQLQYRVQILQNGFAVFHQGNQDTQLPSLNDPGRKYYYIAFR